MAKKQVQPPVKLSDSVERGKEYCCVNCQKMFISRKGCYSRTPMYCSRECFVEDKRAKAPPKRTPHHSIPAEIGTKECPICKSQFEYRVNWIREKKFCSKDCGIKGATLRLATITPEQRSRGMATRSNSVRWAEYVLSRSGANHPNYKGEKRPRKEDYPLKLWRKSVFMRDYYTCQSCNVKGGRLEAHHIKHWATNPELRYDLSNGTTLCYDCHNATHGKTKREKTYHCQICGNKKTSGRRKMCRPCGAKNRAMKPKAADQ